jgi:phage shock protein C
MTRRLYRSYDDRVLAGVAGGMAETYDLDPALVRIGWVVLALLTGGTILVAYIVIALVVPLAPDDQPAGTWPAHSWPTAPGVSLATAPGTSPAAMPAEGAPLDETASYQASTAPEPPPGPAYDEQAPAYPPSPTNQPSMSERELRRQRRHERRRGGGDMAGALIIGLILILIGGYFLLREYGFLAGIAWGQLWPVGLIAIGLLLLVGAFRRTSR